MIKIGTNFDYKAPFFLDARQYAEIPEGRTFYEVLSEWNISVPEGFEVFCGGNWWTYESNYNGITGHFKARSGGGAQPEFTLTITSPTGTGLYVPYNSYKNAITVKWEAKYGEYDVVPTSVEILLNNTTYSVSNPSSGEQTLENVHIEGGDVLKVSASLNGESDEKTVTFVKTYTKYWGVSPNPKINNFNELTAITNATSPTLNQTFDCTGGNYPYYAMPEVIYNSVADRLKMYVDGWQTSAYSVTPLTVNNESYSVIRHDIKQTGIMHIRFTI